MNGISASLQVQVTQHQGIFSLSAKINPLTKGWMIFRAQCPILLLLLIPFRACIAFPVVRFLALFSLFRCRNLFRCNAPFPPVGEQYIRILKMFPLPCNSKDKLFSLHFAWIKPCEATDIQTLIRCANHYFLDTKKFPLSNPLTRIRNKTSTSCSRIKFHAQQLQLPKILQKKKQKRDQLGRHLASEKTLFQFKLFARAEISATPSYLPTDGIAANINSNTWNWRG